MHSTQGYVLRFVNDGFLFCCPPFTEWERSCIAVFCGNPETGVFRRPPIGFMDHWLFLLSPIVRCCWCYDTELYFNTTIESIVALLNNCVLGDVEIDARGAELAGLSHLHPARFNFLPLIIPDGKTDVILGNM